MNFDDKIKLEEGYIETIPDSAKPFLALLEEEELLLTTDQIRESNKIIQSKTNDMYELVEESFSKDRILELIESYKIPSLPKYDGDKVITTADTKGMLENRNIDQIDFNIRKGIVVKRSNLKSFPTELHFYNQKNTNEFDQLQECEMFVNTPILVLHESLDQKWYFIVSNIYAGWIQCENVAFASEEDWNFFLTEEKFIVLTETQIPVLDTVLDMGTKLPYLGISIEGYQASIPVKQSDGNVGKHVIVIPRDQAHIGYLPYTKRNLYIQVFKYEGVPYSWGGMNGTVDCSSYVGNVYRTFGFSFPRNTSSQKKSVGEILSLEGKSNEEKLSLMKGKSPAFLFQPGHIMIYLGNIEEKHYIIHASGDASMKVKLEELNHSNRLSKIDSIVRIY